MTVAPASTCTCATLRIVEKTRIVTDDAGLTAGEVHIGTSQGRIPAYRAAPRDRVKLPVVLLIHEVLGLHEHIKDIARRLAKLGYLVVAPELYHRQGDPRALADFDSIMQLVARVPERQILADLDAAARWAESQGGDPDRLAVTGFCWGGRAAWLYAAHQIRLKAAVAWYGRLGGDPTPLQPRTPLMVAGKLKAPVLGLYGGQDRSIPLQQVEQMRARLEAAKSPSAIKLYPDSAHAFYADYRASYRAADAADAWDCMLDWFRRYGVGEPSSPKRHPGRGYSARQKGRIAPGMAKDEKRSRRYRTLWISDVHLGTPGCKAEQLVDFLKHNECETLYLVGDIIDGWKLKASWYWPQEHTNVIRAVLTKAKRGTKVYYVTGNHDEFLRKFVEYRIEIGNIRVVNEHVHCTADGRELLVLHGDLFDVITRYHRWLAMVGDVAYEAMMRANHSLNRVRSLLGMRYWSLSAFAKQSVKAAVNIISEYEDNIARECQRRGLDGVVCGHIHYAEIRRMHGVEYHNCGDWVESCSALGEKPDGAIEVIRWLDEIAAGETVEPVVTDRSIKPKKPAPVRKAA